MNFPNHVSFTLEHNQQNVIYQTVDDFLIDEMSGYCDPPDFESEDHKLKSILLNELWTLLYYPNDPVAFVYLAAPSLEELVAFAKRRRASDGQ